MFHKNRQNPNLWVENYRQYPAISNSDLTEFQNHLFGLNPYKPYQAFAFGSVLHSLLLEPNKKIIIPESIDTELIERLIDKIKQHRFCNWVMNFSRNETGILFNDKDTGLPCKAKIDLICKKNIIVDIKTTSQRNFDSFVKSCDKYEYDRQAAFYLDALHKQQQVPSAFYFVGVQKKEPFDIFVFDAFSKSNFISGGRRRYKLLLNQWQKIGGLEKFVPPTWNLEKFKNAA